MTVDKGIFIRNIYYMLSYAFQILKQEDYEQHHPELTPAAPTIDWDYFKEFDSPLIQYLPKMKTDIVLTKDNKTLIIDAKYYGKSMIENYDKATLRSAHLYQIFAYQLFQKEGFA